MELRVFAAYVKVVQTGSFTRAAESLGTQKGHLSRVISQFEKRLGVRLLERTTRSLSPTEVGREVFARAVAILDAADEVERVTQRVQGEPRGQLRLTCGVEFGMLAVGDWINRYLQRYRDVTIDADFTGRVIDIVHEGFDLAIRVGPLTDSSLAARRLGELQYGLFAAPDYLARRGAPALPLDLKQHDLVVFTAGAHRPAWQLRAEAETARIELLPKLAVNNSFAARDATLAGLGIAQLPLLVAKAAVATGQLTRVLPRWMPPSVPVNAVFASARYLTPKVRAFIDLAVAEFDSATSAEAASP